jgi:activator of HSP90 ATPase
MVKTTTIKQRVKLPAPPEKVYLALTDSFQHAAFTGAAARIPRKLGGRILAYGGYITGRLLGLFPDRGIIQTWRTTEWPKGCEYSRVEIRLEPLGKGTRLILIHSRVPVSQWKSYRDGWREYYWKPLAKFLKGKPIKKTKPKKKSGKKKRK